MKMSDSIGLEIERRENMSEVKIGADDLRKICRNATNPLATIELCLEWADKAEKIALAMQAEVEEQARLLGASGSREAELLARIEALEKKEAVLYSGYDVLVEVRKEQPSFEITHVSDVLDAVVRLQKAALQEGE